jgi:hypothetical protein
MNSRDELVVTSTKTLAHMKGGTKAITTSCILSLLPTKLVEAPFVVVSVKLVDLQTT